MSIIHLPDSILPLGGQERDPIIIHYYDAPVGSFRGKSMMMTNAVSLVIEGEKTMHFAEKTVYVNDREIHFLSAGNCISSMKFATKNTIKSILLFFDNKTLSNFHVKYSAVIDAIKIDSGKATVPYISICKDAFIDNYIRSLQLLIKSRCAITKEMRLIKFEELMLHLLHTQPLALLSFKAATGEKQKEIELKKVVEANAADNMAVEELAFLCNMSLSTFKRRFAEIYDTSPAKWLLAQRIQQAKELLLYHGATSGDIYHQVGYENHSSFTAAFRQVTGYTPTEFRERNMIVVQQDMDV